MKIELLTQDDPLYILPFFEEFFQYYASEFQILQVSSSRAMGKRPRFQLLRELTYLYGPLGMAKVDRKSTRLNSSHLVISYAVFCLKKKKKTPSQNAARHRGHFPTRPWAAAAPHTRSPCTAT